MAETSTSTAPGLFFGYPSRPELSREAITNAAKTLRKTSGLDVVVWEDLRVAGRLIIDRIIGAIDSAAVSIFDVTTLNENVLFEVGYAIAADRRVWLLRDTSDTSSASKWDEVGVLKTVGYVSYTNSDDIVGAFMSERPDVDAETFFVESIEPTLDPIRDPMLFYIRSAIVTEAERDLSRRIARERREGIRCIFADERESAVQSLTWYAYQCYMSAAVVVHFMRPDRRGATAHNARCALAAGLAHGFGRPLLMLAERGYESPLDYQDLLYVYNTARDCRGRANHWLQRALRDAYSDVASRAAEAEHRSLSTELASIRLGESIAENEADRLSRYFLRTDIYREALQPGTAVFVGRKGTGKTANLIRAADELSQDRRNLVCVLQPSDYDLEGLLRVLDKLGSRDAQGWLVESLWKYLLLSEIALTARDDAADRPAGLQPDDPAWQLDQYFAGPGSHIARDFAVRIERAVERITDLSGADSIEQDRAQISEALHAGDLHELSDRLGPVLASRGRLAILIDNLDQAWDVRRDPAPLAQLLLGLLHTVERLASDLRRIANATLDISLAVFIRSDIYARVVRMAREPDKIPEKTLTWGDTTLLLQVVEERYSAGRNGAPGAELWQRYFDAAVRGTDTPAYIASRVMPRPRDVLTFCTAAIDSAVRHKRTKVTASDVDDAEAAYSRFAFNALLVEAGDAARDLEDLLYGFAGGLSVLSESEVVGVIESSGLPESKQPTADDLLDLMFLGIQTSEGQFDYADDPRDKRRIEALARSFERKAARERTYQVHPAFHAHLGLDDGAAHQPRLSGG